MTKKYLEFLFHHTGIFVIGIVTMASIFALLLAFGGTFAWLIKDTERLIIGRFIMPATGVVIIVVGSYGIGALISQKLSEK